MIPYSEIFDQPTLTTLIQHDALVQRYRTFFSFIDWTALEHSQTHHTPSDRPTHPEAAYIKAFLIKIIEGKNSMHLLRLFLVEHPLLLLVIGFRLHLDPSQPYGFDPQKTVPKKRWLNHTLRTLDPLLLQALLAESVHALQQEIPGLGRPLPLM